MKILNEMIRYMIWEHAEGKGGTVSAIHNKEQEQLFNEDNVKDLYKLIDIEIDSVLCNEDSVFDNVDIKFADKSTLKLELF